MKTKINVGEKWVNRSKGGRIDEVVSVGSYYVKYRTPKGRVCWVYDTAFFRTHVKSLEVS